MFSLGKRVVILGEYIPELPVNFIFNKIWECKEYKNSISVRLQACFLSSSAHTEDTTKNSKRFTEEFIVYLQFSLLYICNGKWVHGGKKRRSKRN